MSTDVCARCGERPVVMPLTRLCRTCWRAIPEPELTERLMATMATPRRRDELPGR